jgi:hypothetical protein
VTSVTDNYRDDVKLLEIDEGQLRQRVDGLVKDAVQDTLNALLDAKADALYGAKRYERSPDRTDIRAGSYRRTVHTKAGEVELKMPKLRRVIFESQVMERYRRRERKAKGGHSRFRLKQQSQTNGGSHHDYSPFPDDDCSERSCHPGTLSCLGAGHCG